MKTDYEFIKEKFDESGVNAPENMDGEFVHDKISGVKQKKNKKPFVIGGISAAAAFAFFTVIAFAVTNIIGSAPKPASVTTETPPALTSFKNTEEVQKTIGKIFKKREKLIQERTDNEAVLDYGLSANGSINSQAKSAAGSGSAVSDNSSASHNSTYTQYTDVDEADTIKTDGRYIYYRGDSSVITVFSADGKKSKKVAEISPSKLKKNNYANVIDFYVYENKLLLNENIYSENRVYAKNGLKYALTESFSSKQSTRVEIFDISDISDIRLLDSFTQSGSYCSSRMIENTLYVVSSHRANDEKDLPCAGVTADRKESTPDEISPGDIYSVKNPGDANFLVVSRIDTENSARKLMTKAVLGCADTVYCNADHLFITAEKYDFEHIYNSAGYYGPRKTSTQIIKVDLKNELSFTAAAKVDGYIDNQYALDEKDGYLRVATTSEQNNVESNRLYIFDKNLKQTGKTERFAELESIKAVRYIGDTAYVITYEETDPLFVIDTSDVKNPKILGEVKISGFSTMLVPVDENTLLGLGYHTQNEDYTDLEVQEGIKLALFDISDKTKPKVLDEKIFKGYNSEVQYNPKALLVNSERGDYTIPYSRYIDDEENDDYSVTINGVINFRVDGKKIKITDEYASDKFTENDDRYGNLERCAYTGEYVYMLGTIYNYDEDYSESSKSAIDAVKYK